MKVSLVLSTKDFMSVISQFEYCSELDIEVLLLDRMNNIPRESYSFPIKIFEPDSNMPNYIRGLQSHLSKSDVVAAVNAEDRLSYFLLVQLKSSIYLLCFFSWKTLRRFMKMI